MSESRYKKSQPQSWLPAFVGITLVSAAVYLTTYFIDKAGSDANSASLWEIVFGPGAHDALASMPEVIAGILGITITVVAIVVELASNRYTPKVTELFVKSPANLAVLGFFVVTGIMCIWVALSGASPEFTPRVGTAFTVFAVTLCMLILLPYFAFVFSFLNPHNIVERMGQSILKAIGKGHGTSGLGLSDAKSAAVDGIEQLADVALNAIEHKDKGICMQAVDVLGESLRVYLSDKDKLPDDWYLLSGNLRENPDFISMQEDVLSDIEHKKYWLEMKVLRQYQMLYGETLNRMRDINYLIAINTRKIGEEAMRLGQDQNMDLAVKFFNTFLRGAINLRDVRTVYNVFNQYRLLAETALKDGHYEVAAEMAMRFKYYGQLGFASGLPFVLETAAYDLCELNELAFELDVPCKDEMLSIFLDVDKEAEEGHVLEASLRGVRKAQVKLAIYYLARGDESLARVVYEDLKSELPARMKSIREELAGITAKDFWEISDRGGNFDYLDPERRAKLETFFSWFSLEQK